MLANASNAAKGLRIGGDRRKGSAAAMVKVQVQARSRNFGVWAFVFVLLPGGIQFHVDPQMRKFSPRGRR
jgi:hypothetical protein